MLLGQRRRAGTKGVTVGAWELLMRCTLLDDASALGRAALRYVVVAWRADALLLVCHSTPPPGSPTPPHRHLLMWTRVAGFTGCSAKSRTIDQTTVPACPHACLPHACLPHAWPIHGTSPAGWPTWGLTSTSARSSWRRRRLHGTPWMPVSPPAGRQQGTAGGQVAVAARRQWTCTLWCGGPCRHAVPAVPASLAPWRQDTCCRPAEPVFCHHALHTCAHLPFSQQSAVVQGAFALVAWPAPIAGCHVAVAMLFTTHPYVAALQTCTLWACPARRRGTARSSRSCCRSSSGKAWSTCWWCAAASSPSRRVWPAAQPQRGRRAPSCRAATAASAGTRLAACVAVVVAKGGLRWQRGTNCLPKGDELPGSSRL